MPIARVVVLGHSGFLGALFCARLAALRPGLEVVGLSAPDTDVATPEGVRALAAALSPETALVSFAGIKRQLGDSPEVFRKNIEIGLGVAAAVEAGLPGRVLHFSSAAVYGEDVENLAITEATALCPRSYYGLAKIAAEFALDQAAGGRSAITHLRPATIYGPGDLHTAYGPSGFLDAAVHARPITLWGEGEELRELLYVEDVIDAAATLLNADHTGPLNLVAGVSYSFQDALAAVRAVTGAVLHITSRPRSKPKVDNRFDAAAVRRLLPGFAFTPLEEGVRRTFAQRYAAHTQGE